MKDIRLWLHSWGATLFFVVYFIGGVFITPDYGIGWDEAIQRDLGITVFDYINEVFGEPFYEGSRVEERLPELDNRHHGSLFQSIAYSLEYAMDIEDYRAKYLLRHYLSFLFYFMGVLAFYGILKMQWKNQWLALLGVLFLVLQPRLFGQSFNNPKDTVFLGFFTLCMYALCLWLKKSDWRRSLLLGLVCGLAMNVRILAFLVPMMLLGMALLEWYSRKWKLEYIRSLILPFLVFLGSFLAFNYLTGPYLWVDPIGNFQYRLESMSQYNWGGQMLYWHEWVWATDRPWHYPFSWIAVTTPLFIFILMLIGSYLVLKANLKCLLQQKQVDRWPFLALVWFWLPLLAIAFKGSTLYDGWRHLFFLAPGMAFLALYAFDHIRKILSLKNRKVFTAAVLLHLFFISIVMVLHHPNQQVYFNWTVGTGMTSRFEMDYFGASYDRAIRQLVDHLPEGQSAKVYMLNWPGHANYYAQDQELKDQLEMVWNMKDADYFISNYRYKDNWEKWYLQKAPYDQPLFELKFRGNPYIGVYDLTKKE